MLVRITDFCFREKFYIQKAGSNTILSYKAYNLNACSIDLCISHLTSALSQPAIIDYKPRYSFVQVSRSTILHIPIQKEFCTLRNCFAEEFAVLMNHHRFDCPSLNAFLLHYTQQFSLNLYLEIQ